MLNSMVTDRSAADRSKWLMLNALNYADMTAAQKAEWLAGLKGAYKASDMNRVEDAVATLQTFMNGADATLKALAASVGVAWDELFNIDFESVSLTTKTDWADGDSIPVNEGERYIDNVRKICEAIEITYTGPDTLASLTIVGANEIEQFLLNVDEEVESRYNRIADLISLASQYVIYSDEIYGGEL